MPLIVEIPSELVARTGRPTLEVDARTVREAINAIDAQHPGFAHDVLPGGDRVRSSLCILHAGRRVSTSAELDRELADGSTVEIDIVRMVAGG